MVVVVCLPCLCLVHRGSVSLVVSLTRTSNAICTLPIVALLAVCVRACVRACVSVFALLCSCASALAYAKPPPPQAFCFNFYVWVCVSKQLGEHYSTCGCVCVCVCMCAPACARSPCVCVCVCVFAQFFILFLLLRLYYCSTRIPSYGCYASVSR